MVLVVVEWLMNITCSVKQEKRVRGELVEANACQSAVEVTRRLLLYPRWCQRGAQGAPAYKRSFPPPIYQVQTEERPSVFV